jgi:hypothetical protein
MWIPKPILSCLATLNRGLREIWYCAMRISREHPNLAKIGHFTWKAKHVLSFPVTLNGHYITLFPWNGIWLLGARKFTHYTNALLSYVTRTLPILLFNICFKTCQFSTFCTLSQPIQGNIRIVPKINVPST